MISALATFDLLSKYAGEETYIKWPNDIYWRDRKAAGILIENIFRGNIWQHALIGIGMNINQTKFVSNPYAVSLKQITGKQYEPVSLAKELCILLINRLEKWVKTPPNNNLNEYNAHLYQLGNRVNLRQGETLFSAVVKGVESNGNLVTQQPNNIFRFGEVEWVR